MRKIHAVSISLWLLLLLPNHTAFSQQTLEEVLVNLKPKLVAPGVISTGDFEYGSSLSEDGKTFAFVKAIRGFERSVLVYSSLENNQWSSPEIFPFSGKWHDTNPYFIGNDTLYFTSRRPVKDETINGSNLWMSVRSNNGFGDAERESRSRHWLPGVGG